MKKRLLYILLFILLSINLGCSQVDSLKKSTDTMQDNELPYAEIPSYEGEEYNSGNILSRMVDGLGYRYYWATEGLRQEDLTYKPSEDARDTRQTLEHLFGLSEVITNTAKNEPTIRPATDWSIMSFEQLRKETLFHLKEASDLFHNKTSEEIEELEVIFEVNGNQRANPFWNMINGPISDAIYHTGQIVSFRRSSGNPINPNVNVFQGKNN